MPQLTAPGSYKCRTNQAREWIGESTEKKTTYLYIPLTVIDGPESGKIVSEKFYITDKTFDKVCDMLEKAFAFDPNDLIKLREHEMTLEGREVMAVCAEETYNEQVRIRIAYINPIGGSVTRASGDSMSRIKGLLARRAERKGQPPPEFAETSGGVGSNPDAEELPF